MYEKAGRLRHGTCGYHRENAWQAVVGVEEDLNV